MPYHPFSKLSSVICHYPVSKLFSDITFEYRNFFVTLPSVRGEIRDKIIKTKRSYGSNSIE